MNLVGFICVFIGIFGNVYGDRFLKAFSEFNITLGSNILGNTTKFVDIPEALSLNVNFLASSRYHALIGTSDFTVYSVGRNENGQLGRNFDLDISGEFSLIGNVENIHYMCAMHRENGGNHFGATIIIDSDNRIYGFGSNYNGMIGQGKTVDKDGNFPDFKDVKNEVFMDGELKDKSFRKLACGVDSAYVLSTDGMVIGWGGNFHREVSSSLDNAIYLPRKIVGLPNDVVDIAAGHHVAYALTESNKVFVWGRGWDGLLGLGNGLLVNMPVPKKISLFDNMVVRQISSFGLSTMVLVDEKDLYIFGKPEFHTETSEPELIAFANPISSISMGFGGAFVIDKTGKLFVSKGHPLAKEEVSLFKEVEDDISIVLSGYQTYILEKKSCGNEKLDGDPATCSSFGRCHWDGDDMISYCRCESGFAHGENNLECLECAAGAYSDRNDVFNSFCSSCPFATYNPLPRSDSPDACKPCIEGSITESEGESSIDQCILCPQGTYTSADKSQCIQCPIGSYGTQPGATSSETCLLCPKGTFGSEPGMKECDSCNPGTVTLTKGSISENNCTICPKGTYREEFKNEASCRNCPPGRYNDMDGATNFASCIECRSGTYNSLEAATSVDDCLPCPAGSFSVLTGRTSNATCELCPKGTYSAMPGIGSVLQCLKCPVGTYNPEEGGNSIDTCLLCPPGTFSETEGLDSVESCTYCPLQTYQDEPGKTSCKSCPQGSVTTKVGGNSTEDCEACSFGTYTENVNGTFICNLCPEGTYGPLAAATSIDDCLPCPAGTYGGSKALTAEKDCTLCPAGTFSPTVGGSNSSVCHPCPPSTFASQNGSTSCDKCPQGYFTLSVTNTGESDCQPCPVGTYAEIIGIDVICTLCPNGTYAEKLAAISPEVCLPCPEGTWSNEEGVAFKGNCTECPPGTYSGNQGQTTQETCTECPPGHYQEFFGMASISSCTPCPPGSFGSLSGAASLTDCTLVPPGTYSPFPAQLTIHSALPCPFRRYSNDFGASECVVCPSGHRTMDTGSTHLSDCFPCDGGSFIVDDLSIVDCSACPAGTWSPPGSSECIKCNEGTFSTAEGAASIDTCVPCPPGYWSHKGSKECQPCKNGTYSEKYGTKSQDECIPCFRGSFNNFEGAGSKDNCTLCERGFVSLEVGAIKCTPCPPGYYAPDVGSSSCVSCSLGTYNPESGQSSCRICPTGTMGVLNSSTSIQNCLPCAVGSFQNQPSSSTCLSCEEHGFCPVGSSAMLPRSQQFSSALSDVFDPQTLESLNHTDRTILIKWIPIVIFIAMTLMTGILLCCGGLCYGRNHDPFIFFRKVDLLFKLNHYVEVNENPVKKQTHIGGFFGVLAVSVITCLVYASTIDFFFANTIVSESFRIQDLKTDALLSSHLKRYRGVVYLFGNFPHCSNYTVDAQGFVPLSKPVHSNGTCTQRQTWKNADLPNCECVWECEDCQHEGLEQTISFNAPRVLTNVIGYELQVPHYLVDESENVNRLYSINGTIVPPEGTLFYSPNYENGVQVFFSLFHSLYVKHESIFTPLLNLFDFLDVKSSGQTSMSGLTSQLLSIVQGTTTTIADEDPKNGFHCQFKIEISRFVFLLEELSRQTSLNFFAQLAALAGAVLTVMKLGLLSTEYVLYKFNQKKRQFKEKIEKRKFEKQEMKEYEKEMMEENDALTKDGKFTNAAVFGGKSTKPGRLLSTNSEIELKDVKLKQGSALSSHLSPTQKKLSARRLARQKENSEFDSRRVCFSSAILSLLQQYQLNEFYGVTSQKWKLIYRGSQNGFHGKKFHSKCDEQGPTLVVCKAENGSVFGGFLSTDWHSENSWIQAPIGSCWLFSLVSPKGENPIKIPNIDSKQVAFGGKGYGPIFGAGNDLLISSNCHQNNSSNSNLGKCYGLDNLTFGTKEAQEFLTGSRAFTIVDYEVFALENSWYEDV